MNENEYVSTSTGADQERSHDSRSGVVFKNTESEEPGVGVQKLQHDGRGYVQMIAFLHDRPLTRKSRPVTCK